MKTNVRQGLQARAQDFAKEKLLQMGHKQENINTDLVNLAFDQWGDNPEFQRDLAADTWMNRIQLQETDKFQRAQAVMNAVENNQVAVDQLSTADLNLVNGFRKERQVFNAREGADQRVNAMFPGDKQLNTQDVRVAKMDTQRNLHLLRDTDNLRRAQAINQGLLEGQFSARDLDTSDLGLVNAFINVENAENGWNEAFSKSKEKDRMQAAKTFLNNSNPNSQISTDQFIQLNNQSNQKFKDIKQQRGVIGEGAFGAVVPGASPNTVMKLQGPASDVWNDGSIRPNDAIQEADNLEYVRGMNIAPTVHSVETLADGSTIMEMNDLSKNFKQMSKREDELSSNERNRVDIKRFQQQAMANLKGIDLQDRHTGNVMLNNMTNNPIQVDFGIVDKFVDTTDQANAIALNSGNAMVAAGLEEEGKILYETVSALRAAGDFAGALDVAKQGMAMAMKLRKPVNAPTASQVTNKPGILTQAGVAF